MSPPDIHAAAERGFTAGVDAYERGRPSYPPEVVEFLTESFGLGPGRTVIDVGAGTGKFTRLLTSSGARVVAVEPVAAMRDRLLALVPGVEVLEGRAEDLGLPDHSADAVTVAQAFHWVDAQPALAEFARVLRPGGGLALVWNSRDASVPWVGELNRIIRWNAGQIPTYDAGDERWLEVIEQADAYGPVELRSFRNDQEIDHAGLADRVASTSYIAAMPPDEREGVLAQVRRLTAGFPDRFVLPHLTYVYWCRTRS